MKTRNTLIFSAILGAFAFAAPSMAVDGQTAPPAAPVIVSVASNGNDVCTVLKDLFTQAKLNYVIEPGIHYAVSLSLSKVDFDETLGIVLHLAKLKAEKVNGIYYVSQGDTKPAAPTQTESKPPVDLPPPVTQSTLKTKIITTRLAKADIRRVFAAISKEAGIPISVDQTVPQLKLDAFLQKTSLKYALDEITGAAKLRYRIVDKKSILIFADDTENRVSIVSETN